MSANEQDQRPPAGRVDDLPRILCALRQAAAEAMERHRRAGVPVAVWRNEGVELLDPSDPLLVPVPSQAEPLGPSTAVSPRS